jgi:D-cysteine desulfhydrase
LAEKLRVPSLVAAYPQVTLPFLPLTRVPTPVERCTALADYLGRNDVWIKRDDCVSQIYGGNKIRRFEWVLAAARERGARRLVTVGGLGSTQVTATALIGASEGFAVSAVLFDQPVTDFVRRAVRADLAAGAQLIYGGSYVRSAWRTLAALRDQPRTYFVFPGASGPLANLGYIDAMFELGEQVAVGACPRPDFIVVPTGSGGTLVGLGIGAAMLGWPTEIVGVRIAPRSVCNYLGMRFLEARTKHFLGKVAPSTRALRLPPIRFRLFGGAAGRGYGHPTAEAEVGAREVERVTGVPGEITYSGKALVGVRHLAASQPEKVVMYWHTLSSNWTVLPITPESTVPAELRCVLARATAVAPLARAHRERSGFPRS